MSISIAVVAMINQHRGNHHSVHSKFNEIELLSLQRTESQDMNILELLLTLLLTDKPLIKKVSSRKITLFGC